jgi:hypothetical protein
MKPSVLWVVLGVAVIVLVVFAGLAPLPGQKDEPTPLTEDVVPGKAPRPPLPSGPPHSKPGEPASPPNPAKQ